MDLQRCNRCSIVLAANEMSTHLRLVHFYCEKCDRAFSNKSNLTKHDRVKHSRTFAGKELQTIASFNPGSWLCVTCERFFDQINPVHDCLLIGRELIARQRPSESQVFEEFSQKEDGQCEDGSVSDKLDMREFLCFKGIVFVCGFLLLIRDKNTTSIIIYKLFPLPKHWSLAENEGADVALENERKYLCQFSVRFSD